MRLDGFNLQFKQCLNGVWTALTNKVTKDAGSSHHGFIGDKSSSFDMFITKAVVIPHGPVKLICVMWKVVLAKAELSPSFAVPLSPTVFFIIFQHLPLFLQSESSLFKV